MDYELYKFEEPHKKDYESLSRNELEERMFVFISHLLETDFEKLCNLIYRHDVDEQKFGKALQNIDFDKRAREITYLVIEREMEKIKMREAYKKYKEEKNRKSIDE